MSISTWDSKLHFSYTVCELKPVNATAILSGILLYFRIKKKKSVRNVNIRFRDFSLWESAFYSCNIQLLMSKAVGHKLGMKNIFLLNGDTLSPYFPLWGILKNLSFLAEIHIKFLTKTYLHLSSKGFCTANHKEPQGPRNCNYTVCCAPQRRMIRPAGQLRKLLRLTAQARGAALPIMMQLLLQLFLQKAGIFIPI